MCPEIHKLVFCANNLYVKATNWHCGSIFFTQISIFWAEIRIFANSAHRLIFLELKLVLLLYSPTITLWSKNNNLF